MVFYLLFWSRSDDFIGGWISFFFQVFLLVSYLLFGAFCMQAMASPYLVLKCLGSGEGISRTLIEYIESS